MTEMFGRPCNVTPAEQLVLAADVAAGPFLIAMQRFGATLEDFPKLAKYTETLKVCNQCPSVICEVPEVLQLHCCDKRPSKTKISSLKFFRGSPIITAHSAGH